MTTKNPNKSPKNKLPIIKDISKSRLLIKWENNPTFNLDNLILYACSNQNQSTILGKLAAEKDKSN